MVMETLSPPRPQPEVDPAQARQPFDAFEASVIEMRTQLAALEGAPTTPQGDQVAPPADPLDATAVFPVADTTEPGKVEALKGKAVNAGKLAVSGLKAVVRLPGATMDRIGGERRANRQRSKDLVDRTRTKWSSDRIYNEKGKNGEPDKIIGTPTFEHKTWLWPGNWDRNHSHRKAKRSREGRAAEERGHMIDHIDLRTDKGTAHEYHHPYDIRGGQKSRNYELGRRPGMRAVPLGEGRYQLRKSVEAWRQKSTPESTFDAWRDTTAFAERLEGLVKRYSDAADEITFTAMVQKLQDSVERASTPQARLEAEQRMHVKLGEIEEDRRRARDQLPEIRTELHQVRYWQARLEVQATKHRGIDEELVNSVRNGETKIGLLEKSERKHIHSHILPVVRGQERAAFEGEDDSVLWMNATMNGVTGDWVIRPDGLTLIRLGEGQEMPTSNHLKPGNVLQVKQEIRERVDKLTEGVRSRAGEDFDEAAYRRHHEMLAVRAHLSKTAGVSPEELDASMADPAWKDWVSRFDELYHLDDEELARRASARP